MAVNYSKVAFLIYIYEVFQKKEEEEEKEGKTKQNGRVVEECDPKLIFNSAAGCIK